MLLYFLPIQLYDLLRNLCSLFIWLNHLYISFYISSFYSGSNALDHTSTLSYNFLKCSSRFSILFFFFYSFFFYKRIYPFLYFISVVSPCHQVFVVYMSLFNTENESYNCKYPLLSKSVLVPEFGS